MKEEFTKEEIRVLKKMAQEHLRFERIFLYDEKGRKIPRGSYSDYVKAMRGETLNKNSP